MRLAPAVLNRLVETLATECAGGTIAIYDGDPPSSPLDPVPTFRDPLVSLRFQSPAFSPAKDGRALAKILEPQGIANTGEASWARLAGDDGDVKADLIVRSKDSPEAREADIVVDRSDFHRGGICTLSSVVLRLPAI